MTSTVWVVTHEVYASNGDTVEVFEAVFSTEEKAKTYMYNAGLRGIYTVFVREVSVDAGLIDILLKIDERLEEADAEVAKQVQSLENRKVTLTRRKEKIEKVLNS